MGGGGSPPISFGSGSGGGSGSSGSTRQIIQHQRDQIISQQELNQKKNQVDREVSKVINSNKENADPNINDHGVEHGNRVAQKVRALEDVLEDSGTVEGDLRYELTQEDKFILYVASKTHDIGRVIGADKDHPKVSSDFVQNDETIPLTPDQRALVAKLALLHADGTTREMYGTDDLAELARRGIISKREAYLASILRVGDALDAGKKRIRQNTLGESEEQTIRRIHRLPEQKQQQQLSHWQGHKGINSADPVNRNGKVTLEISLDASELESHGVNVAERVRDIIRDSSSSVMDRKYTVRFSGRNPHDIQEWYEKNQDVLYDELEGMQVSIGEE